MTPRRTTPLIIADRGASAEAPEHTIAAFEMALDQGADGIALDVHLTRDGQPIVIHDFTLERTTDGAGAVAAHTIREMKRLDAGAWWSQRFQGQRVQTLQEVLERFRDRTRFWIEIRGGSDLYPGIEERVVSMVEIYEVEDRTLVQSMDLKALGQIHALNPGIALGAVVYGSSLEPFLRATSCAQALCLLPEHLSEAVEGDRRGTGLACYVRAWDGPTSLERLNSWDVDGNHHHPAEPGPGQARPVVHRITVSPRQAPRPRTRRPRTPGGGTCARSCPGSARRSLPPARRGVGLERWALRTPRRDRTLHPEVAAAPRPAYWPRPTSKLRVVKLISRSSF